jgi:hypothetical protein
MSIFVKFYTRYLGAGFVVVLVLDKILIFEHEYENEDEKYQPRSSDSAHMRNYKVSFSIRPAVFFAGGGADT